MQGRDLMKNLDLFIDGETDTTQEHKSEYQTWKIKHHYGVSDNKQKCDNCASLRKVQCGNTYYKCKEMGTSSSAATDVRLRNTCDLWKGK